VGRGTKHTPKAGKSVIVRLFSRISAIPHPSRRLRALVAPTDRPTDRSQLGLINFSSPVSATQPLILEPAEINEPAIFATLRADRFADLTSVI